MKTAIVYYSMSGNTKMIAERIAKELSADMIELIPEKAYPDKGMRKFLWGGFAAVMSEKPKLYPYSFDAQNYDTILIGSPVWASNVAPPIRTFVEENKDSLKEKRFGVFLCYAGGGADKALEKLKKLLNINRFISELVLVDPKEKSAEEYKDQVHTFCESVKY
ncbi:MAG: flavodoxin family protein [Ruminococcus sp.]|nr:flavodoxin family protein [Ruminococcus sp.]